jgi:hypothetical protein
MHRAVLPLTFVLTITACSAPGTTELELGDRAQELGPDRDRDRDDDAAHSGVRLRARFLEGSGVREFAYFDDRRLGTRCSFDRHADGSWRCLPGRPHAFYGLQFLDDQCTEAVIFDDLPDEYIGVADTSGEEWLIRAGRLGERVAYGATLYSVENGACQAGETEPGVGRRWTEIPAHRLVRATEQTVPLGRRLAERVLRGDDGSRAPLEFSAFDSITYSGKRTWVDRRIDAVVTPSRTRWREAFRGEVTWAGELGYVDTSTFTDATCETPVVYDYSDDPEAVAVDQRLVPGTCTLRGALYSLERAEETFASEGGTCTSLGEVSDDDYALKTFGERVDDRYVHGDLAPRAGHRSNRYTPLEIDNHDGSRIRLGWFDRELQLPCDVYESGTTGEGRCRVSANRDLYRFFSDAACTHRVLALDAHAIEAQACYDGPAPTFVVGNSEDDLPDGQIYLATAGARLPDKTLVYLSRFADGKECTELNDSYALFELASERLVTIPTIRVR